jgi:cytochrome b pre-mRNA-processing protein 3
MQAIRRLFRPREAETAGRRLYTAAVAHARQPALYVEGGVPDTAEGRFEIYTLHLVLVLHRLKGQGPRAAETAQALFDTYLRSLDDALREMGVGDLSVGKKMRKLGEAFYGRVKSYDAILDGEGDDAGLEALIGRTVLAGVEGADPRPLAAYVRACVPALAAQPVEQILDCQLAWPAFGEPRP